MGQKVPKEPDAGNHTHKRVFVVGTKGFVHWRFSSWERATPEGGYESGPLNYGEQDVVAQGQPHRSRFRLAGRREQAASHAS